MGKKKKKGGKKQKGKGVEVNRPRKEK